MTAGASVALNARSATGLAASRRDRVDFLVLLEEIKAIVMKAAAARRTLRIGPDAKRLSELYQSAEFSRERIADELIIAAAHAGVPVEIDRSD
jgi:predicted dienelactone hydrolase